MAEQTPLDMAHQIMQNAPEDEAARMRFYERLADSELFLLLKEEAVGDNLLPEMISSLPKSWAKAATNRHGRC